MDDYLVCYDISDEKRLRRVARVLEGMALRVQYSVFLSLGVKKEEIYDEFERVTSKLDVNSDDLRIYRVKSSGVRMGKGVNIREIFIL